jgi:hypothetical protein
VVSAEMLGEHVRARLAGAPAVSLAAVVIPPAGRVTTGTRLLLAYWITMLAAAVFVFGLAMTVQGVAAAVLPRRQFLRASSWLQLATFCLVVGTYFMQPMVIRPEVFARCAERRMVCWAALAVVSRPVAGAQWIACARASGA